VEHPGREHGTVFVTPGKDEVAVLKQFEQEYDGRVTGTSGSSPENEARAVAGVQWLGAQMDARRVDSALFLANHPARQGIDSPHELRAWRDADPRVAVGMEGAPGHQAAGLPDGAAAGRGFYDNAGTNPARFVPYPPESFRTWGGFDWMTSTVGGLWDSMLAEGKPWWISANSDSHSNYLAFATRGPGSDFARDGFYQDPVYAGGPNETAGDFWPASTAGPTSASSATATGRSCRGSGTAGYGSTTAVSSRRSAWSSAAPAAAAPPSPSGPSCRSPAGRGSSCPSPSPCRTCPTGPRSCRRSTGST
jgi:hypothetical protein